MEQFFTDFNNLIYIATAASGWFTAVTIKVILNMLLRGDGKLTPRYLLTSGGIPSVHASFVSSVVLLVGLRLGFYSPEFGLGLVLLGVVVYDAMGVRRATDENTKAIQAIIKENNHQYDQGQLSRHMGRGHSFHQIIVGIIVGLLCGLGNHLIFPEVEKPPEDLGLHYNSEIVDQSKNRDVWGYSSAG